MTVPEDYVLQMTDDGWRVSSRSDEAVTLTKKKSNVPLHIAFAVATFLTLFVTPLLSLVVVVGWIVLAVRRPAPDQAVVYADGTVVKTEKKKLG
jgi:hypothetical protein